MKYLVILEPTATGFSAYSPDLDGCVAAGADREETIGLMREAIALHLGGLAEMGRAIPTPASEPAFIEVPQVIRSTIARSSGAMISPAQAAEGFDRGEILQGSVIKFEDPFGPAVAEDEWEACR